MHIKPKTIYKCPVCGKPLINEGSILQCENNHVFDLASEGYVNLLLAHEKKSKNPGDNKDMVSGRRAFLEKGYYEILSDSVNKLIFKYLGNFKTLAILDAGCGEGYYLRRLSYSGLTNLYGIDISKPAIIMASKKEKQSKHPISYAVGNTSLLPYLDSTFSIVLSVFSPFIPSELKRITKQNGIVITVGPGKNHLKELAAKIYKTVNPHAGNKNELEESDGFTLIDNQKIGYSLELQNEEVMNLLVMTPYYWSISVEAKEYLEKLADLKVSLDFEIKVYKRK